MKSLSENINEGLFKSHDDWQDKLEDTSINVDYLAIEKVVKILSDSIDNGKSNMRNILSHIVDDLKSKYTDDPQRLLDIYGSIYEVNKKYEPEFSKVLREIK